MPITCRYRRYHGFHKALAEWVWCQNFQPTVYLWQTLDTPSWMLPNVSMSHPPFLECRLLGISGDGIPPPTLAWSCSWLNDPDTVRVGWGLWCPSISVWAHRCPRQFWQGNYSSGLSGLVLPWPACDLFSTLFVLGCFSTYCSWYNDTFKDPK